MSDTLASLHRQINGADKLQSVVRTMKAVAASSIEQYEAAVRALADYEHSVELGLSVCFRQSDSARMPPSKGSGPKVIGAIVFGSDQGLVGQFNEVMAEFVEKSLATMPGTKRVWAVGERIQGYLADSGLPLEERFAIPGSVEAITTLVGQLQIAVEAQVNGGCQEVYVFHSQPAGSLSEPISRRLLPLDAVWQDVLRKTRWPAGSLPEPFGDAGTTTQACVREYLFITLFKACAESLASENTGRLAAMQRAEKNIDSRLAELNRSFYRLRQNSIDEELFEVVAGFDALS